MANDMPPVSFITKHINYAWKHCQNRNTAERATLQAILIIMTMLMNNNSNIIIIIINNNADISETMA